MKKILLLLLLSFAFGQTDNIGSEVFYLTADHLFHSGRDKAFSDGTYLFKSNDDRTTVDTSGMFITDTTVGAAVGSRLLQGGEIITATADDINMLAGLYTTDSSLVYVTPSGYSPQIPKTVYGWSHDMVFSATDYNTIAWSSGTLTYANGDTYSIDAGNTGNISDVTYIYFDENTSATVLQTTTTAGSAVSLGRIIVCVGEDVASPKDAVYQVFGGEGSGVLITADNIAANTITANELAANSVTTNEINFTAVNQDSILYQINASSEGLFITGDRINITGSTSFASGYDPSEKALTVRQDARPDSTNYSPGDMWIDTNDGDRPYTLKDATPDTWVAALTVIDGGNITTGTIDASVATITNIDADNITTGTLDADEVAITGTLTSVTISSGTITGSTFTAQGSRIEIADQYIDFHHDYVGTGPSIRFYDNTAAADGGIWYDKTGGLSITGDAVTIDTDLTVTGDTEVEHIDIDRTLSIDPPSYVTISSGQIAGSENYSVIYLDPEGAGTTDELARAHFGKDGQLLYLMCYGGSDVITIIDDASNSGDYYEFHMLDGNDWILNPTECATFIFNSQRAAWIATNGDH